VALLSWVGTVNCLCNNRVPPLQSVVSGHAVAAREAAVRSQRNSARYMPTLADVSLLLLLLLLLA
jgi:hypothetical protein